MNYSRWIYRLINHGLSIAGLRLVRDTKDFNIRVIDDITVGRMLDGISSSFDNWFRATDLFHHIQTDPTKANILMDSDLNFRREVEWFFDKYMSFHFRDSFGGSRFNNLLSLYLTAKVLKPSLIIDSGTYTGASAWALSLGSPTSEIKSFDIDMSRLKVKVLGLNSLKRIGRCTIS